MTFEDAPVDLEPSGAAAGESGGPIESGSSAKLAKVRLLARVPFYPLLLAAYAVLLLYSDNLAEVPARDVIAPLLLVVVVTGVGFGLLAMLWRAPRRAAIVVTAVVLPFLAFGLMTDLVAPSWPNYPIVRAYLLVFAGWGAVVAFSVYLAARLQGRLGALTEALNAVSVVLILMALIPVIGSAATTSGPAGRDAATSPFRNVEATIVGESKPKRDIYHLVFDRYGSDKALQAGRGIDNSAFSDWLRGQGFDVVEDARANYERTALSLASIQSMSLQDELAAAMGSDSDDQRPLYDRIRNSAAAGILQQQGYRYYYLGSWFRPTATSDIADVVNTPEFQVSFVSTLLDRSVIAAIDALVTLATRSSPRDNAKRTAQVTSEQFERLASISKEPGPKYVFAHVLIPHDPYLFLEDGTFDPTRASYETQLGYANARMRDFVEPLLRLPPDEQPIIILQSDEGPYPSRYVGGSNPFDWSTASDAELATKFGVLNAMYLPGPEGVSPLPQAMSLVNTYPEVLRRYFGMDVPNLPDRSYTLRDGKFYDQTDVTDRLDQAIAELPDPG